MKTFKALCLREKFLRAHFGETEVFFARVRTWNRNLIFQFDCNKYNYRLVPRTT